MAILRSTSDGIAERAVSALQEGKIIVYPTDTLYGLGVDATRDDCVKQVFMLKKRDPEYPISVMVSSFRMLKSFAEMSPKQEALVRALLPGKVTVVLESRGLARNLAPSGMAFRIPLNPLAAEIVELFNRPITATSVNPADERPATTCQGAFDFFGELVELYIDAGTLDSEPSTVVDLRGSEPEIVRQGADYERVLSVLGIPAPKRLPPKPQAVELAVSSPQPGLRPVKAIVITALEHKVAKPAPVKISAKRAPKAKPKKATPKKSKPAKKKR